MVPARGEVDVERAYAVCHSARRVKRARPLGAASASTTMERMVGGVKEVKYEELGALSVTCLRWASNPPTPRRPLTLDTETWRLSLRTDSLA